MRPSQLPADHSLSSLGGDVPPVGTLLSHAVLPFAAVGLLRPAPPDLLLP